MAANDPTAAQEFGTVLGKRGGLPDRGGFIETITGGLFGSIGGFSTGGGAGAFDSFGLTDGPFGSVPGFPGLGGQSSGGGGFIAGFGGGATPENRGPGFR